MPKPKKLVCERRVSGVLVDQYADGRPGLLAAQFRLAADAVLTERKLDSWTGGTFTIRFEWEPR